MGRTRPRTCAKHGLKSSPGQLCASLVFAAELKCRPASLPSLFARAAALQQQLAVCLPLAFHLASAFLEQECIFFKHCFMAAIVRRCCSVYVGFSCDSSCARQSRAADYYLFCSSWTRRDRNLLHTFLSNSMTSIGPIYQAF
jgi:hypothetical protein